MQYPVILVFVIYLKKKLKLKQYVCIMSHTISFTKLSQILTDHSLFKLNFQDAEPSDSVQSPRLAGLLSVQSKSGRHSFVRTEADVLVSPGPQERHL